MPSVIPYSTVMRQLPASGFASLYHNSGAFGFAADASVQTIGWIGSDDASIRESARAYVSRVEPPYAPSLVRRFGEARLAVTGEAWLMPKSHWHYELHFGNRELLESLLNELGLDPSVLRDRNSGDAICFAVDETDRLTMAVQRLLESLRGSDFLVAFPAGQTLCTIHHHQQLWWQTTDEVAANAMRGGVLP